MLFACSEGVADKEEGEALVQGKLLKKTRHRSFLEIGRSFQDSTVRLSTLIRHSLEAEVHDKVERPSRARITPGPKDEEHHCLGRNMTHIEKQCLLKYHLMCSVDNNHKVRAMIVNPEFVSRPAKL